MYIVHTDSYNDFGSSLMFLDEIKCGSIKVEQKRRRGKKRERERIKSKERKNDRGGKSMHKRRILHV